MTDLPPLLAFGAHPDDIEFGAGGIIAGETARGRAAHFVVGTRGEAATHGTPEQRAAEAAAGAAALGATLEFVDLGGDTALTATRAHALVVAAVIRRVRPGIVLAPTVVPDQHPDHAALGRLVRDAARLARYGGVPELSAQPAHLVGALLHYAITVEGEPRMEGPLLIDVSAHLATWTAAMQTHGSQAASRAYVELQMARARVLGLRAGVEHAMPLWPAEPPVFDGLGSLGWGARRF
jgi:N-acetylglucosamine malate deacetylase 1